MTKNNELINNKESLCIWGMGYLGYSNLVKYSNHGINVLATDFGSETTRLDEIKKNNFPSNKLKNDFIHHKFSKPKFSNLNIVKNNKNVFNKKIALHIMCNSESLYFHKNTKNILLNWLINNKKIVFKNKPIFVIEFINSPGTISNDFIYVLNKNKIKLNKDYDLIFSPRKDWNFDEFNSNKIRPFWSSNAKAANKFREVLEITGDQPYEVKDLKNLEVLSNLDSSISHVSNMLINQLSKSYNELNFYDIIDDYNFIYKKNIKFSTIGSRGIRMPHSSLNLFQGSQNSEINTILKESIFTDFSLYKNILSQAISFNPKKVGILGLGFSDSNTYEGISPSLEIFKGLIVEKINVKLNDPKVSKDDYKELSDVSFFKFPNGLGEFDMIILASDNDEYSSISWNNLKKFIKSKIIIDTTGIWSKFPWSKINTKYILISN